MAAFHYRALDGEGTETTGTLEADNPRVARHLLRERGLFPTVVEAARDQKTLRQKAVRLGELCLMTRQFSALLTSGLTVERALSALAEQSEQASMRLLLTAIRSEVRAGHTLRDTLEQFGDTFPPIYRASVAAGEQSGQLAQVMAQLADYLERQDGLRRRTIQALVYPVIVAVVALLVVIGLMTYVVPQVVEVFQQGRQQLPLLTRMMILVSAFLREWGGVLSALAVVCVVGGRMALRDSRVRAEWDRQLLRLPLIGRHLRTLDTTRFASTLAILISSGVPILAALEAGRQIMSRAPLREAVQTAGERVREGVALSAALRQSGCFPPLLIHMISSGEATGQLSEMLERASRLQQVEVENRTFFLTTLLEPALLLFMGGAVLVIVLAVMQPIIEINTLMK